MPRKGSFEGPKRPKPLKGMSLSSDGFAVMAGCVSRNEHITVQTNGITEHDCLSAGSHGVRWLSSGQPWPSSASSST